jgi:hypothetical protein
MSKAEQSDSQRRCAACRRTPTIMVTKAEVLGYERELTEVAVEAVDRRRRRVD